MSRQQHAGSLMLSVTVLVIVPLLILMLGNDTSWLFLSPTPLSLMTLISGFFLVGLGLYILGRTARLFASIGRGTLAPWAPTQSLVVVGMYRHVRNPMITGVLISLLGESLAFMSVPILAWSVFFFLGNHVYFIKSEEPGLLKRFGQDYLVYTENVPRWIPRRTPWDGPSN